MAYNSQWTGPQIDNAISRVRNSAESWDGKQDKLKGNVKQILGFDALGNPIPKLPEDFGLPTSEGFEHYADTVADNALQSAKDYTDKSISKIEFPTGSGLPNGGIPGQILAKKTSADGDAEWIDPPSDGEGGGSGLPSSAIQQMIDESINKLTATDIEFTGAENGLASDNVGDAINELDGVVADVETSIEGLNTAKNEIIEKVNGLDENVKNIGSSVNNINNTITSINADIGRIDSNIENTDTKISEIIDSVNTIKETTESLETNVDSLQKTVDEIQSKPSVSAKQYTVILKTGEWVNKEQSFTINGISTDESAQLIQPVPAQADFQTYADCEIKALQSLNRITFVCEDIPEQDIKMYIAIQELQSV